jgi:hypothetical protein
MIKLIKYIFLFLILSGSMVSYAQYENTSGNKQQEKKPQEKRQALRKEPRWFGGGMIGAGFGSYGGYFELSPLVGYKVTPHFHVGSRLTYIYSSYKDYYGHRQQSHTYGGSLFGRYTFLKLLYAQAEFELLSFKHFYNLPQGERYLLTNLYLGGGFYQSFGNGFATLGIFYNVLEDPNVYYPYSNPLIRIGFGFGF